MFVLLDPSGLSVALRCGIGALAAALIAAAGWALRALTISGAIAAVIIGALVFGFGGLPLSAALVAFFASGSVLSRIAQRRRLSGAFEPAKTARRDAAQVGANGGLAALLMVAGWLAPGGSSAQTALLLGAFGAIAAACGDTWSTEIGALFGRAPRSILTLQRANAGESGAITLEGTLAAPAGGLVCGVAAWLCTAHVPAAPWLLIGAVSGAVGSLADSVLGASLQARWRCDTCGKVSETKLHGCAAAVRLVRGWAWLDNDGVNALATIVGAAVGAILAASSAGT